MNEDLRYTKRQVTDENDKITVGSNSMKNSYDQREAVTVSYQEYEKRKRSSREGMTVRLSDASPDSLNFNPVEVALSDEKSHLTEGYFELTQKNSNKKSQIENEMTVKKPLLYNNPAEPFAYRQINEFLMPVGWMICIEGPDCGKSFPLKEGKNVIGRSESMDISLKNDVFVFDNQAYIEYYEKSCCFYVHPGEARKLVYLNDDILLISSSIKKNDILNLGDSKLMLIPCCDEKFSWSNIRNK